MSSTVFENVENHVLGIDDFNKVCIACKPFCACWEDIACHLDIPRHSVNTIKANDNDVNKRFSELIAVWLKRERPEQPLPTWRVMCNAIASVDRGSAEKIAEKHQCDCDKCTGHQDPPKIHPHVSEPRKPGLPGIDVWNSRPEIAELENHVRTNSWYALGLQLGLNNGELDALELQYRGDIATCRRKMFSLWLQTKPKPSRQQLIVVLKTEAVAEMYIAEQYESYIRTRLI